MLRRKLYILPSLLMTLIWCILNERFDFLMLVIGFLISVLVIISQAYIFELDHHERYNLNITPLNLMKFFGVLFLSIFRSSVGTIKWIITGKHNAGFVRTKILHENKFHQMFIANAITLTPGTVTVDTEGDEFIILWIDKNTDDQEEARSQIHKAFDEVIG